jgi:DNA-binding CsgD family transcriptional regulator
VHGHVKKIYGKLHAVNRSEALRKAASLGYLTPP